VGWTPRRRLVPPVGASVNKEEIVPLHKGSSQKTIGKNIKEMRAAGHPQAQSVAAAMREAGKSRDGKKK
jgi:hypothetical protein